MIRTSRLEEAKLALEDAGISGLTCESVRGYGKQLGQTEHFRGSNYALNLVPKTRIEVVVLDEQVEDVLAALVSACQTGEIGDGKVFISDVVDALRIRTGERGEAALQ